MGRAAKIKQNLRLEKYWSKSQKSTYIRPIHCVIYFNELRWSSQSKVRVETVRKETGYNDVFPGMIIRQSKSIIVFFCFESFSEPCGTFKGEESLSVQIITDGPSYLKQLELTELEEQWINMDAILSYEAIFG